MVSNLLTRALFANYTEGLGFKPDASLSIYLATELPNGVPLANWLPIPDCALGILLRVYGPEGSVANNTYVPPSIDRGH